jgi:uncharacterized protein
MKERTVAIVSLSLLLILALTAWTQDQPASGEPRWVSVTGEAEVRVVPDEVILTLGIETWDKDLDTAKRQNDAILGRVLALTQELDVPAEHVQTDYLSIDPRYDNGYYDERDFIGYFVRKNVVITLRDLDLFEGLLSGALEAGVNYVHGVEFRTTELRRYRDEARALATNAAREKAAALAGELGQQVGEPLTIQEVQAGWWSSYNAWWGARWNSGMSQNVIQEIGGTGLLTDSSLAPGQIKVSARVNVSFEMSR